MFLFIFTPFIFVSFAFMLVSGISTVETWSLRPVSLPSTRPQVHTKFNYHVIFSSSWSLNSKIFILRSCSHMRHKCKCKCKCKYKKYMGELHQCIYKHKCKRQLKVWKKFHFLALATALANTRIKKWFHATMA